MPTASAACAALLADWPTPRSAVTYPAMLSEGMTGSVFAGRARPGARNSTMAPVVSFTEFTAPFPDATRPRRRGSTLLATARTAWVSSSVRVTALLVMGRPRRTEPGRPPLERRAFGGGPGLRRCGLRRAPFEDSPDRIDVLRSDEALGATAVNEQLPKLAAPFESSRLGNAAWRSGRRRQISPIMRLTTG